MRVPWTVFRGDTGSDDAAIEAPPEVARLDGRAVPGGEDQGSINPAISRTVTVGILLLLSDLQCGHAQIRQRQRASEVSVLTSRRTSRPLTRWSCSPTYSSAASKST